MREIYLDYAAATPLDQRVVLVMEPYLTENFYNPSAAYQKARQVRVAVEEARHRLAMAIGAKQHDIVVTAGATESINLAIRGVMGQYGGRVATSQIEHAAVVGAAQYQPVDWIAADGRGCIVPEAVRQAITPETTLVSVGYVNNELGTVQSLREIAGVIDRERQARLAARNTHPIWLHTDASQAVGMLDIAVARLGVDLMTLSSAKCYGPKQVGLLWRHSDIRLTPLLAGGGQENGLRPGTENVAGVMGCAEALSLAVAERHSEAPRLAALRDDLQRLLCDALPDMIVNGHPKKRAPHILHVSLDGLDGERAIFAFEERGVLAATGSACAANRATRSHVLTAIGMSPSLADGSLRFSLGRTTTVADVRSAAEIIVDSIKRERGR